MIATFECHDVTWSWIRNGADPHETLLRSDPISGHACSRRTGLIAALSLVWAGLGWAVSKLLPTVDMDIMTRVLTGSGSVTR